MKLIQPFRGVPNGEIYPVDYKPGDECPEELVAAATALGALPDQKQAAPAVAQATLESRAQSKVPPKAKAK